MAYKMIQVGTGGFGSVWCGGILPPAVREGLVEVVAAVDINPEALKNAQKDLGLPAEKCYTDINRAFDENPADFCTVVVPPAFHENVVDVALAHKMHILSEKPIADTLEVAIRINEKVRRANVKMAVTMSHRFDQDKYSFESELHSGKYGKLDYLVCRSISQLRNYGAWGGPFRHEMESPMLIEGGVHHFDILRNLAGDKCDTVYATTWTPPWGEYKGDCQALVSMIFQNGVKALYEGTRANAAGLNTFGQKYIRAECEKATLILSQRKLERFLYQADIDSRTEGQGEQIPLLEQNKWAHSWLFEQFIHWLDGGSPMKTNVQDNLQSLAINFAAVESSRTGSPVRVQEYLKRIRNSVMGEGL